MRNLGTVGLNRQYTILRVKFSGAGTIFKIIPWGLTETFSPSDNFHDYPFIKPVTMVSLSLGNEYVNFVPYDSEDILVIARNPIRILQAAVLERRRNRTDRAAIAWEQLFPSMGASFAGSPINMSFRYLVPAIVFVDDNLQYQTPRGIGQTKVLLSLPKTAVGGIIGCILKDGLRILGPNNIVMHAQPRQSKYTPGEGVYAKQYIVNTLEYPVAPEILKIIENIFETNILNSWDSVIKPLPPEEQLELLFASNVPKSAVVYALQHTEWSNKIPENYLKAGLEELSMLNTGRMPYSYIPQESYPEVPNPVVYKPNPIPTQNIPSMNVGPVQSGVNVTDGNYGSSVPIPGVPQTLYVQHGVPDVNLRQNVNQYVQREVPKEVSPSTDIPADTQTAPQTTNIPNDMTEVPLPTNVKDILDSLKNKLK